MAVSERRVRDLLTRRQMLQGAGGVAALAIAGGGVAELLAGSRPSRPPRPSDPSKGLPHIPSFADKPSGRQASFRSQPDLRPPTVTTNAVETAERLRQGDPRFLFLGPGPVALSGNEQYGPMIVARNGAPVWFRPLSGGLQVSSFFSSTYQGEPVARVVGGKRSSRLDTAMAKRFCSIAPIARSRACAPPAAGRWTCTP